MLEFSHREGAERIFFGDVFYETSDSTFGVGITRLLDLPDMQA